MTGHDIIVIGASAGGVEALSRLVKDLPANFPASVFIVLHVPPHGTSILPKILNRLGTLHAIHPKDGQAIERGHIYVAPPDQHLLVKQGYVTLSRGPKENGHRPAIDPLFRTASRTYDGRVIGVVLSGVLDDGTAGLLALKMRNGLAVVQDPDDAMYNGMPRSAIENVDVDHIVPISDLANLLTRLASEPVPHGKKLASPELEWESDMAELEPSAVDNENRPGKPAVFACPECGGSLWEVQEGDLIRFRCRVGHAFSAQTLLAEQFEALEEALWVALRALEESSSLARRMAERSLARGHELAAQRFTEQAETADQHAATVREVILNGVVKPHAIDPPSEQENAENAD